MQHSLRGVIIWSALAFTIGATPVFAESAPVFDVDSMPSSFEGDVEQSQQELPMPPAPGQESAFVPVQSAAKAVSSSAAFSSANPSSSTSLDQRVRNLEQQIHVAQNNESAAHIDSLQNQIQSLRDQVEQLTHQLQQVQNQQKSIISKPLPADNEDDSSVAKVSSAKAKVIPVKVAAVKSSVKTTAGAGTKKTSDDQPNVAEEQQIYQTAYNLIKTKKYSEAVDALQGMLKKYPSGQFASNAHYWLGELYGLMDKNDLALTEFSTVVTTYPESPRVSDAQLKVGLIYSAQSKWADAKTSFKNVINHHPGTASARVASEQLKQIKLAGH